MKVSKNQFLLTPNTVIQSSKIEADVSFLFEGYRVFLGEGCLYTMVRRQAKAALLLGYIVDAKKRDVDSQLLLGRFLEIIDEDPNNITKCVRDWGGVGVLSIK